MKKYKYIQWRHYTPKKGKKAVSIFRFSEWITVYRNEVIMAHESHEDMLLMAGLERCGGVKVYKTKRAALEGKDNYFVRPTE